MISTSALGSTVARWKLFGESVSSKFGQRKRTKRRAPLGSVTFEKLMNMQVEMLSKGSGEASARALTPGSSAQSWCYMNSQFKINAAFQTERSVLQDCCVYTQC